MKKLFFLMAMVAILAAPAAAQPVDVSIGGNIIASFVSENWYSDYVGYDYGNFLLMSPIDFDYSTLTFKADAGKASGMVEAVMADYIAYETSYQNNFYIKQAYATWNGVNPFIDQVKMGQYTFPFAAQEWLGWMKGMESMVTLTAPGVEVSGTIGGVDYRVGFMNAVDFQDVFYSFDYGDSSTSVLLGRLDMPIGPVQAGLSFVTQDDSSAWGLNGAYSFGAIDLVGEFISASNFEGEYQSESASSTFIFVGARMNTGGPWTPFAKVYNASTDFVSGTAFGVGVDYAVSDNMTVTAQLMNDTSGVWSNPYGVSSTDVPTTFSVTGKLIF